MKSLLRLARGGMAGGAPRLLIYCPLARLHAAQAFADLANVCPLYCRFSRAGELLPSSFTHVDER